MMLENGFGNTLPIDVCPVPFKSITLGSAYNQFGFNEHPAITSSFICIFYYLVSALVPEVSVSTPIKLLTLKTILDQ